MGARINFFKMPAFQGNIATGNTIQTFLDGGPTYEELQLHCANVVAADIAQFIVEVNGDLRVQLTGQQMLDLEAYEGRTATSNEFVFSFSDALARTIQGEASGGLVTKPGDRVLVKIVLGTLGGSEAFDLYAVTSPNRVEELRRYVVPEAVPITLTGDNDYKGLRSGNFTNEIRIRRMFNYGNVTHLRIEQDQRFPYGKDKLLKAVNDSLLARHGKTVPSSCYVFDPIFRGNTLIDLFDTFSRQSLTVTMTTGDSNAVTSIVDYLEMTRQPAAA